MTDNADLIAEARGVLSRPIRADHESEEARGVIQRLADALEAAERERDNWKMSAEEAERAEKRWKDRAYAYSTERDQLAVGEEAQGLSEELAAYIRGRIENEERKTND